MLCTVKQRPGTWRLGHFVPLLGSWITSITSPFSAHSFKFSFIIKEDILCVFVLHFFFSSLLNSLAHCFKTKTKSRSEAWQSSKTHFFPFQPLPLPLSQVSSDWLTLANKTSDQQGGRGFSAHSQSCSYGQQSTRETQEQSKQHTKLEDSLKHFYIQIKRLWSICLIFQEATEKPKIDFFSI